MTPRQPAKHAIHLTLITLLVAALSACGGGGGGGDSESNDPDIVYNGSRSAAVIDADNAESVSTSAYTGGADTSAVGSESAETALDILLRDVAHSSEENSASRTQGIALFAKTTLQSLLTDRATGTLTRAPITERDTLTGNCGGSTSYSVTGDEETGEFDGQFAFADFCNEGETLDGDMSFALEIDFQTFDMAFHLDFGRLTVNNESDSYTLSGDMNMFSNELFTQLELQMDLVLLDNNNDQTYWVNDLTMTMENGGSYIDATFTGRFFDSQIGYVDVTTETPLRTFNGNEWPSEGSFVIEGAGGAKARVTALSETTYQLEVDEDGDDVYDPPQTLLWGANEA